MIRALLSCGLSLPLVTLGLLYFGCWQVSLADDANLEEGRRIYVDGIGISGEPVTATVSGDVEISGEVADGPQSVIAQQVTNGLAVRMAILAAISSGKSQR